MKPPGTTTRPLKSQFLARMKARSAAKRSLSSTKLPLALMRGLSRMTQSSTRHMRPSSRGKKTMASLLATTKSSRPGPSRIGSRASITSLVNQHPSGTKGQEKPSVRTLQRLKTSTLLLAHSLIGAVTTDSRSRLL